MRLNGMRLRWPGQVWAQVLLIQLAIAAVVSGLAAALFLAPLSGGSTGRR